MDHLDFDLNSGPPPMPVTILSGFLGAGKTTLLNRILTGNHGLRVAVLVNDFGDINIDADLVVGVESDVISLANGCICCTIRDDLIETVTETINRPEKPEYILLEASGVADPAGIAVTFTAPGFRDRIRLDSILCVVDAEQIFAAPELMQLKMWQIGCADMVILNKVDLVDQAQLDQIKAWLDSFLHRYRLVAASRGEVPLEILLSVGRFDPAQGALGVQALQGGGCDDPLCSHKNHQCGNHADSFSTWSYETDRPLSLAALKDAASRLPVSIYRAKGIIYSKDAPQRRAVLQVVGKRVDITLADDWNGRRPRTQIVAIGAPAGIDPQILQQQFDACLGQPLVADL